MTPRPPPAALPAALVGLAATLAVARTPPVAAQVPDTTGTPVDSVVVAPEADPTLVQGARDSVELPMSPRGAFIRSMVLPGWGQVAFDAHLRGGVYFTGWVGNWYMNVRNYMRLDDAREDFGVREGAVRDSLITASENPDSLRNALEEDPTILDAAIRADSAGNDLRKLVRAREQQREDWIAWSIFWLLASGVDAYVTAHLADFPADIEIRPNRDRSVSVGLEVPLPGRRP